MSLRLATHSDLEHIGSLLWSMHREIGIASVSERKAREAVLRTLNEPTSCCILAEREGKIVGVLGLVLTSWWYSEERFLTDLFFFVDPSHRADVHANGENAGHATKLIAWAKAAARKLNVPLVISVGTEIAPLPKVRFMSKHMNPFGGSFIYKPGAA